MRILSLCFAVLGLFLPSAGTAQAAELMYVTLGNNSVVSYDVSLANATAIQNSQQVFTSSGMNTPRGLAFDTTGNLYVANLFGGINKYDSTGNLTSTITANLNRPFGLVFDSSGNLYAASLLGNTINKYDASDNYVSGITTSLPMGLAFDSTGILYASTSNDNIKKFDSSGTDVGTISGLNQPQQIAFSPSGDLYVVNNGNSRVLKYNAAGVYQSSITTGLNGPMGLAFDSLGNLFVANLTGKSISKYNAAGTLQFTWSTGTASANFLTFKPVAVPEPSTYALGAIATGLLAFVARRRKAQKTA